MKRVLISLTAVLVIGLFFAGTAAAQEGYLDPEPYRIQPGDTLSSIAQEFCTTWQDIYRYNAGIIGTDPNALNPGTLIYVIDRCDPNTVHDRGPSTHAQGTVNGNVYTVAAGDTLYSIGRRFGLNYQVIMDANGLDSTSVVVPGSQLIIPGLNVGHAPPSITITSPPSGSTFLRPFTVQGTGQSLHENNVVVSMYDAGGNLISQQATVMQSSEVGGAGTWQVSFPGIIVQANSTGRIEAFNPETGAADETYVFIPGY
ncbi:MAG: LysM peptidoglycan-binding domain-containing protein [Candidatus Promineifilaceae bacterium]|nr:LysM peptidoglycan-binding domain-containing protein [Candidatus Promineifilaceae bacterium]